MKPTGQIAAIPAGMILADHLAENEMSLITVMRTENVRPVINAAGSRYEHASAADFFKGSLDEIRKWSAVKITAWQVRPEMSCVDIAISRIETKNAANAGNEGIALSGGDRLGEALTATAYLSCRGQKITLERRTQGHRKIPDDFIPELTDFRELFEKAAEKREELDRKPFIYRPQDWKRAAVLYGKARMEELDPEHFTGTAWQMLEKASEIAARRGLTGHKRVPDVLGEMFHRL